MILHSGVRALGVRPAPGFQDACLAYVRLLMDWNRVFSLTAAQSAGEIIRRHVLDALALLPYLRGWSCLDLGSGAGLPGLVLALAAPERRWVLLDASLKKTRFLRQVCMELQPSGAGPGITVERCRAEDYRPERGFDTVTARAVGEPRQVLRLATPLCAPGGRVLLCRGMAPGAAEWTALERESGVARCHRLVVPGAAHRCLLELEPRPAAPRGVGA